MTPQDFTAQDFKAWRKALKLSQAATAEALGLSKVTVQMYEAGKRFDDGRPVEIPRTVQLACAALAHGLTPADARPAAFVHADEDLRDARTALAAPRATDLPAEAVARLVAGEPPLAVLAQARGLTLEELAARAGLPQDRVAQLAAGSREGSSEDWRALAAALQVDPELLQPAAA